MGRERVLLGVAITMVLALLAVTPNMAGAWGNCGYSNCSYGNYGYMNNYGHMSNYGYSNNYGYKNNYGYGNNYGYKSNYGYSNNYGYKNNYGYSNNYGYKNNYGYSNNYGYKNSYGWYCVRWGDSLSKIAARYGVSAGYLQWLNGLANPNVIYAGEYLRVPGY